MTWLIGKLAFQPDLSRALRAAVAFSLALLICSYLGAPLASQFAATAALAMSFLQLRGAYHVRVIILLGTLLIFTCSAFAGALAAGSIIKSVLGIGTLALLSAVWRQLSTDYGPPISVDSALLFLISMEGPLHGASAVQIATWVAMGAVGAGLLQLALWFFRPQHALRHAVAESWIAASDLFLAMRPGPDRSLPSSSVAPKQRSLREALDRSTGVLATTSRNDAGLVSHLDQMRHESAHLAMQITALHTASEALIASPEFTRCAASYDSLMAELANVARSVAITLVTHRPHHFELSAVRMETCQRLVQVLEEQIANVNTRETNQVRSILRSVMTELDAVRRALGDTIERTGRASSSPFRLTELSSQSMRLIAAGLNPVQRPDPVLTRYGLRMAVLSMFAVAVYQLLEIPRGYWMALAIIVVLQPDYGSTRQRAAHRVAGTFAGALLGSALLMVKLPVWLLATFTSLMAFGFAYFLKRKYRVAVFFVTVMLVLVTELHAPVHLDFTIGRLLSNLAGSGLALVAALYFWPRWEREEFPALLTKATRANCDYFQAVASRLTQGGTFDRDVIRSKQHAERAGIIAATSLQRMSGEPRQQQGSISHVASIVASTERVTRAISVLATHLSTEPRQTEPRVIRLIKEVGNQFEEIATAVAEFSSQSGSMSGNPKAEHEVDRAANGSETPSTSNVIVHSLEKLLTEVLALLSAIRTKAESQKI